MFQSGKRLSVRWIENPGICSFRSPPQNSPHENLRARANRRRLGLSKHRLTVPYDNDYWLLSWSVSYLRPHPDLKEAEGKHLRIAPYANDASGLIGSQRPVAIFLGEADSQVISWIIQSLCLSMAGRRFEDVWTGEFLHQATERVPLDRLSRSPDERPIGRPDRT